MHLFLPLLSTTLGTALAQTCPSLPSTITYATNPKLPDPFLPINGTVRLTTKAQWPCRKEEIRQLLQRYEYGVLPPKPRSVTASLSGGTSLQITVTDNGKSMSFAVAIKLPSSGSAPYPAIIAYGGSSIPIPSTVATITYQNFEMAADNGRGKGKFYELYGSGHNAGGMIAAAWGVDRIMDALELVPETKIDAKRVGVTGCSRNSKGAMISGAFVDRIAPTPLLLLVGRQDRLSATELALQAYERAREPKKLAWLPGGHFDAYDGAGFEISSAEATSWYVEHLCHG